MERTSESERHERLRRDCRWNTPERFIGQKERANRVKFVEIEENQERSNPRKH